MRWNRSHIEASKLAEEAMQQPPEKIVEDLYADFYNSEIPSIDGHKTSLILAHHAALLAAISKAQEQTAQKNMKMQEGILVLTKWLFAITVVLLIVSLCQVYIALHPPH